MSLSQKAIEEFKQAYLDEFKEELSDAQAQEIGERLIALFRIVCRPIPEETKHEQSDKQDKTFFGALTIIHLGL